MQRLHTIIVVQNDHPCFQACLEYLSEECREEMITLPFPQLERAISPSDTTYCLISYQQAIRNHKLLIELTDRYRYVYSIIYDAPDHLPTSALLKCGRLRGYFPSHFNVNELMLGVVAITQGKWHIPDQIASQLLEYYQASIVRFSEPYNTGLTHREIEVLTCLRGGLSNTKLADELFVSEHTVKSHLYKIFKKLSVSNRSQAIAWAHKYLP